MNTHEHVFHQEADEAYDEHFKKWYIEAWWVCDCGEHRPGGRFDSQSATQHLRDLVSVGNSVRHAGGDAQKGRVE